MKRLPQYSQNFLQSPQLVQELVSRSSLNRHDTVYDIGAGSGVISSVLASRVNKVIAIEFEPGIAKTLKRNMAKYGNVEVLVADFLTLKLPKTPYKVFANIPFHLSSPIVQRFINSDTSPEAACLVVQKQFGRKLVATDTTHFTSQLGMLIGAEYEVKIARNLKKTDFFPHPAVETVFIELYKRKQPLVEKSRLKAYETFTAECFAHRNKLAKMPLEAIGQTAGFSPSRISLDQWVHLFHSQKRY
jgi:16S rRNA A1518/A1519 N6-dimethyltransferase RsmA/KsgA/DIM1 with predicted DNA glycosylase/AP lyase activity